MARLMKAAQISALEGFHSQLTTTFGWDSTTAYAHEGVSLEHQAVTLTVPAARRTSSTTPSQWRG